MALTPKPTDRYLEYLRKIGKLVAAYDAGHVTEREVCEHGEKLLLHAWGEHLQQTQGQGLQVIRPTVTGRC